MNDKKDINVEVLDKLRQQLISRIESTDDATLLSRCLAVMDTAQVLSQEEQEKELSYEDDNDPNDYDIDSKSRFHMPSRRQLALFTGVVLLACCGYWLVDYLKNRKEEHVLVTVAKDFETIEVNGYKFNMVKVKGGTFTMGATDDMGDYDNDERPPHQVTLTDYSIGETEVTQGLWFAVMGTRPMSPDGDNHPMKEVSYDESVDFIEKLNKMTGRHFHLPTEAQWEFAAKGGNQGRQTLYAGSNKFEEVGWCAENCWNLGKESPDFGNHAVGMKKPNELGIYDMSGNVWEWCHGSYERYTEAPQVNPVLNEKTQGAFRCNRGGSWDYVSKSARVCNRRNRTRDFRNFNLGLRLAEEPETN